MITKSEIKLIQSLKQKKQRNINNLFVAEGEKLVEHLLRLDIKPHKIYTTQIRDNEFAFLNISNKEMAQISNLNTPSTVLGVFVKPKKKDGLPKTDFVLVLDGLRDPGNMGTILRLCDWFGISELVFTEDCVDRFNEKVVQASMGSIASIEVFEMNRADLTESLKSKGYKIVTTAMQSEPVYTFNYPQKTALVLGNEGQGVSEEILKSSDFNISIPAAINTKAESLNVAMAASVLLSDYARKSP